MTLKVQRQSSLGKRPAAVNHLNGCSFQQDALVTHKNWQYAVYYLDASPGIRHLHLARRRLPTGSWEAIHFDDYQQTEDDGHNIPSLGICPKDGSIHMVWDLHDSPLNYRHCLCDLTSDPEKADWSAKNFSAVIHHLPGLRDMASELQESTYPRFVSLPEDRGGGLLLELRTGISGLGDDWLFYYPSPVEPQTWGRRGIYLKGVKNNPYINGLHISPKDGSLHTTWCYRDYIPVTLEQSRQQAGPNGPENNHDLLHAFSPISPDGFPGVEWYSVGGDHIGTSDIRPILPTSGAIAFDIPKYSGILNQEAQVVDIDGTVWVLNRENVKGLSTWLLYNVTLRTSTPLPILPISSTSARGKLAVYKSRLLALLPLQQDLIILDTQNGEELCWIAGAGGAKGQEVLLDRYRDDVLSLFLGINGELVVVDLEFAD